MRLHVAVLGAGSFGTTIAHLAAGNTSATLWCRRAETADEVNREHRNERYLSGCALNPKLRATASLEEAVSAAERALDESKSYVSRIETDSEEQKERVESLEAEVARLSDQLGSRPEAGDDFHVRMREAEAALGGIAGHGDDTDQLIVRIENG